MSQRKVEEFSIIYDEEAQAAYIDLSPHRTKYEGISKRQVCFTIPEDIPRGEVIVDFDENGRVLGIEVL